MNVHRVNSASQWIFVIAGALTFFLFAESVPASHFISKQRDPSMLRVGTRRTMKQSNDTQPQGQDATGKRGQPPRSTQIASPISIDPAIHDHYVAENRDRPMNSLREWMRLCIEAVALISAIFAAIFTYRTLHEIRQQTMSVRKSADAATESANIAHDAMVRSNRPWVGLDGVPTFAGPLVIDERGVTHAEVIITLKNFSSSPALYVSMHTALSIGHREDFDDAADLTCLMAESGTNPIPPSKEKTGRYIFPNGMQQYRITHSFQHGNTRPKVGDALNVIGCVVYSDQFQVVHHTRFCYMSNYPPPDQVPRLIPCALNQRID